MWKLPRRTALVGTSRSEDIRGQVEIQRQHCKSKSFAKRFRIALLESVVPPEVVGQQDDAILIDFSCTRMQVFFWSLTAQGHTTSDCQQSLVCLVVARLFLNT